MTKLVTPNGQTGQQICNSEESGGKMDSCVWVKDLQKKNYPCSQQLNKSELGDVIVNCKISKEQMWKKSQLGDHYTFDISYSYTYGQVAKINCLHSMCERGVIGYFNYAVYGLQSGISPNFEYSQYCHQNISAYLKQLCTDQQQCQIKVDENLLNLPKQFQNPTIQEDISLCQQKRQELTLNVVVSCHCSKVDEPYPNESNQTEQPCLDNLVHMV